MSCPDELVVTTKQLARILDCTPRWIFQLTERGILQQLKDQGDGQIVAGRYRLGESVRSYVRYTRSLRVPNSEAEAYERARLRRAEATAKLQEIALAKQQGRSIDVEEFNNFLSGTYGNFKQRFRSSASLGFIKVLYGKYPDLEAGQRLMLDHVDRALNEVSDHYEAQMVARERQKYSLEPPQMKKTNGHEPEEETPDQGTD